MLINAHDGSAEFLWCPFARAAPREIYGDFLSTMSLGYVGIYIANQEGATNEGIDWTLFLHPFSSSLWIVIILTAIISAFVIYFMEKVFVGQVFAFERIIQRSWEFFTFNFQGAPSPLTIEKFESYKIFVVISSLACVVMWASFNSDLISLFSVKIVKYPFNNLESLAKSDYRYFSYVLKNVNVILM